MVRVRINGEYSTLIRYSDCCRGSEWIAVRPAYNKYGANVWEIWQRMFLAGRKRQPWQYVTHCGSYAGFCDRWESLTGQIISYKDYIHE